MAGSKTSSLGILLVIQAKECHVDSKKAQGCVVFTLQVLSEKAQGVTITDCHAGNPCVHISNGRRAKKGRALMDNHWLIQKDKLELDDKLN
ncbi:hypothetical protein Tco_0700238 [Tanacetum coccineum]